MYELLTIFNAKVKKEVENINAILSQKDGLQLSIFDNPSCFNECPNKKHSQSLWGRHGVYIFLIDHDEFISENKVRKWNELNQGASLRIIKPMI